MAPIDPYTVDRTPDDGVQKPSILARVGRYLSGMEVASTSRGDGEVLATRASALLEEVGRLERENAKLRKLFMYAPHGDDCWTFVEDANPSDCDCYISRAES